VLSGDILREAFFADNRPGDVSIPGTVEDAYLAGASPPSGPWDMMSSGSGDE